MVGMFENILLENVQMCVCVCVCMYEQFKPQPTVLASWGKVYKPPLLCCHTPLNGRINQIHLSEQIGLCVLVFLCVFTLVLNVYVNGGQGAYERSCVEGRGGRDGHCDASLIHPWKRGHDPYCTQTAFQSSRDMERMSAYLPQSCMDKTGNMRRELSRLAIQDKGRL